MRKDTNRNVKQQLDLMRVSDQELRESNMLSRLSINRDKEQLKAAIPEPDITVVNLNPSSMYFGMITSFMGPFFLARSQRTHLMFGGIFLHFRRSLYPPQALDLDVPLR